VTAFWLIPHIVRFFTDKSLVPNQSIVVSRIRCTHDGNDPINDLSIEISPPYLHTVLDTYVEPQGLTTETTTASPVTLGIPFMNPGDRIAVYVVSSSSSYSSFSDHCTVTIRGLGVTSQENQLSVMEHWWWRLALVVALLSAPLSIVLGRVLPPEISGISWVFTLLPFLSPLWLWANISRMRADRSQDQLATWKQ
jgi:hypothetical protein